MPIEIVGGSVDLEPNGTGTITLRYARKCQILKIGFVNTGRVRLDNLEIVGIEKLITGVTEVDALKQQNNFFIFDEAFEWPSGQDLVFSFTDVSGAANKVSVAVVVKY